MTVTMHLLPGRRLLRAGSLRAWTCAFAFIVVLGSVNAAAPGAIIPAAPGVSFDQKLGAQLPLELAFHDETGRSVLLRDNFKQKPVVLVFGYSRCPQLCSVVANATVETLRDLRATAGPDYSVLYVSIDPTDSPRQLAGLKERDVRRYGRGAADAWHYLGGDDASIRRLTDAAGFHYTYDERQKLYAHASGFLVATPDGRISKYFLGVDYDPQVVADALERAGAGKIGDSVYNLILVCARGLGISGKYGRLIWGVLEVSVIATVLAVGGGIAWMVRQERRKQRLPEGVSP